MKVVDWYWEYDGDTVPIYVTIEDDGFTRIENLEEGSLRRTKKNETK